VTAQLTARNPHKAEAVVTIWVVLAVPLVVRQQVHCIIHFSRSHPSSTDSAINTADGDKDVFIHAEAKHSLVHCYLSVYVVAGNYPKIQVIAHITHNISSKLSGKDEIRGIHDQDGAGREQSAIE
jgi:hypothetical protein